MDQYLQLATQVVPFIVLFAVLYFFMIRPQKKREKSIQEMRNALEVGDYATTIGGIVGKIVAVRDNQVTLETGADRVKIHITKWAIQSSGKESIPE